LLLQTLWYRINPKAQTEELLVKTFALTAEFSLKPVVNWLSTWRTEMNCNPKLGTKYKVK